MAMTRTLGVTLAAMLAGGCGKLIRYEAPDGFAAAEGDWRSAHYKGNDNVGLKLLVFDNVEGGTLEFWGADLVPKLQARGYELRSQHAVTSGNRVPGIRYDFALREAYGFPEPQFLVVALFVTDKYRYVAQLAGAQRHLPAYDPKVPAILAGLRPRG